MRNLGGAARAGIIVVALIVVAAIAWAVLWFTLPTGAVPPQGAKQVQGRLEPLARPQEGAVARLMEGVRQVFDPRGIFNPSLRQG